jgi:predicted lipid-binding transport protein (Tim44 family)
VLSSKLWALALSCVFTLVAQDAVAQRLGGAGLLGKPSVNVSQRTDLARAQAAPMLVATVAAGAVAAAPKSGLGAVLFGAAAGLGLGWLASTLGLGDAVAQWLLITLIAVAVLAVLGFLRRRRPASAGMALQSAGAGNASGSSQLDPLTPRGYSSKNVGNDASARPWEQYPAMLEPHVDSASGSVSAGFPGWGVPDGFDTVGFLEASKTNFVSLQAAWDRSDMAALRAMMTDGMLEQIRLQLAEREQIQGEAANQTDVVMLQAHLLGIEEVGPGYLASVEFSGLIREDASAGPNPFREVWNITRAKAGSGGWLVAGVQALQ